MKFLARLKTINEYAKHIQFNFSSQIETMFSFTCFVCNKQKKFYPHYSRCTKLFSSSFDTLLSTANTVVAKQKLHIKVSPHKSMETYFK